MKNRNEDLHTLREEELTRYARNIVLKEIGQNGQLNLKRSRVLVIGAGGIGSPLLLYLTAAGVGKITVIEFDYVDLTNLQRQILYTTSDLGRKKSTILEKKLRELNPGIEIHVHEEKLSPENAYSLIHNADVVIDGSDNYATKFLVNDVCYFKKIPLVTGAVSEFYGIILGIIPDVTFCYRCFLDSLPEQRERSVNAGILGAMAGVIGSLMAMETIKFLLHIEPNIMGGILQVDGKTMEYRFRRFSKNRNCMLCGEKKVMTGFYPEHPDYREFTGPVSHLP